jgi:hypothetical protein
MQGNDQHMLFSLKLEQATANQRPRTQIELRVHFLELVAMDLRFAIGLIVPAKIDDAERETSVGRYVLLRFASHSHKDGTKRLVPPDQSIQCIL